MRLPWVSRRLYDAAERARETEREMNHYLRRQLLDAAQEKHDLLSRYHMLRLNGAVDAPQPIQRVERVVDACEAAIARKSGGDPELRAMMLEQLAMDRAAGMSDGDILLAIQLGHTATDGGPIS